MPYQISKFPNVEVQIRALAKRARDRGVFAQFVGAVQNVHARLKNDPLNWGDPEYNTKHPGGVVCHGLEEPLLVHFAVYEKEQVVLILSIEALTGSSLAEE